MVSLLESISADFARLEADTKSEVRSGVGAGEWELVGFGGLVWGRGQVGEWVIR